MTPPPDRSGPVPARSTKKERALVVGATKTFWPALVALYSASRHISLPYEMVVYYFDMPERDRVSFEKVGVRRFIEFDEYADDAELSAGYTHMTYFRYEMHNLLHEYRQVLSLDIDTLTVGSLDGMLERYKTGYCGVNDYDYRVDWEDRGWPEEIIPHRPLPANLNAGVIIVNDDIPRYGEIADWCRMATGKYRARFNKGHTGDQGIVNLVPHVFCGGWTDMDLVYNTTSLKMDAVHDPVILHFTGGPKPWCQPGDTERSRALYGNRYFELWHEWSLKTRLHLGSAPADSRDGTGSRRSEAAAP